MIVLRERLKNELNEIQKVVNKMEEFIKRLSQENDDVSKSALSMAIALNLHSFYTGAERIFEAIAKQVDKYQPSGANWHRQLLDQMFVDLPELRPSVISEKIYLVFDELRRFRHVVRTIYSYDLNEEQIIDLAKKTINIFPDFQNEIITFISSI
jgi:ribosomal protein L31